MGNDVSSYETCELGAYCEISTPVPWTLHLGKCKDGTRLSAFVYDSTTTNKDCIKNAIKQLKTLKHPGIPKFLGVKESKDETWVLTELVRPLELIIDTLAVEEVCAGIYSIIQVLYFLHEAGLCHNNIHTGNIFVALDGCWKLGGLEWLCRFTDATPSHLASASKWRSTQAVAPEEKAKNFAPSSTHGFARDVYAFGHLAEQLLEFMVSLGDLTKTFELRIADECLHTDPEQRPKLNSLLDDRLFRCDYVEIMQFLTTVTLQNEVDKEIFFKSLVKRLYTFPVELMASRLVRPLLARFVLLENSVGEYVLPHLLKPAADEERTKEFVEGDVNPLLPESLFTKYIIPELFKIFHVRDAHVRITLLRHFSVYVNYFDKELLQTVLLPQVLLGIRDTNDDLVALSLQALADMVKVLGGDIVIGAHRSRVFSQGLPKVCTKVTENGIVNGSPRIADIKQQQSPKHALASEERERKRAEARKRVEERRKKREEERIKFAEKVSLESDDGGPADINRSEVTAQLICDGENNENSPTEEDPKTSDHTEDLHDVTESDIDLEIEAEIEAMESTLEPKQQIKIYSDDVKVNWGDLAKDGQDKKSERNIHKNTGERGGILKLSPGSKTRTSPPPKKSEYSNDSRNFSRTSSQEISDHNSREYMSNADSNWNASEDWDGINNGEGDNWGNEWGDSNKLENVDTSPEKEKNVTTVATKNNKSTNKKISNKNSSKKAANTDLGAEFDIMALDIKTGISREVDYFADMMPDIKPKAKSLMTALSLPDPAGQGEVKSSEAKSNSKPVSFAVADNSADVESGWDDVDNWNES